MWDHFISNQFSETHVELEDHALGSPPLRQSA